MSSYIGILVFIWWCVYVFNQITLFTTQNYVKFLRLIEPHYNSVIEFLHGYILLQDAAVSSYIWMLILIFIRWKTYSCFSDETFHHVQLQEFLTKNWTTRRCVMVIIHMYFIPQDAVVSSYIWMVILIFIRWKTYICFSDETIHHVQLQEFLTKNWTTCRCVMLIIHMYFRPQDAVV